MDKANFLVQKTLFSVTTIGYTFLTVVNKSLYAVHIEICTSSNDGIFVKEMLSTQSIFPQLDLCECAKWDAFHFISWKPCWIRFITYITVAIAEIQSMLMFIFLVFINIQMALMNVSEWRNSLTCLAFISNVNLPKWCLYAIYIKTKKNYVLLAGRFNLYCLISNICLW